MKSTQESTTELPLKLVDELERLCKERKFTGAEKKKAYVLLQEAYDKAKISPGEAIGIITAESFGEPGTQMTLNVFHFAGVSEMSVTAGLPRLIEIFDATKAPKTPQIEVYLQAKFKKSPEAVKKIAGQLKQTVLEEVVKEFSINSAKMCVEAKLDHGKLKKLGIRSPEILQPLTKVRGVTLTQTKTKISITPKNKSTLGELYYLKEKMKQVFVHGVKNITHVLPLKKDDEYLILTAGSNLKDILTIDGVDTARTRSNDLYQTAKVYGIEAARQVIMDEAGKVIQNQGLDVDVRHIMLLADVMTAKGAVKGITRFGITSEKASVLARASFETPLKHLVAASLIGEIDPLNSVIENVMMNQPIPLGTGLPDLVVRMKKPKPKGKKK